MERRAGPAYRRGVGYWGHPRFPAKHMIQKPDRTTRRNRRRSGTAILELGMMLLPTMSVIFGFLDIGFAIFTWNTLQNAAREGTRYAITYQVEGSLGQRQSVKNKTAAWALGFVNANSTSTSGSQVPWVDVRFYSQNGNEVTGSGGNTPGNIVEVSIRNYPYRWMFPFSGSFTGVYYAPLGSTLSVNVYSADVLGGYGLGTSPPAL
jgi:Flp pilus assembly protein TadG